VRRNAGIIITAGFALMGIVFANAGVQTFFLLPLVFILPGYALVRALLPGTPLARAEMLVLSLGISFAVSALGGVALHLLPDGLQARAWGTLLGGTTLLACIVGWLRRSNRVALNKRQRQLPITTAQIALLVLAFCLLAGAWLLAIHSASNPPVEGFTQLWMLPNDENSLGLGIASFEKQLTVFRLRIMQDGNLLREWQSIRLMPAETWETTLEFPPNVVSGSAVLAQLYRVSEPDVVYRHVRLWVGERS